MNSNKKIVTRKALKRIVSRLRRKRTIIAFTNGCFDLLHRGHVSYLEKAKGKGRVLVIGVNSDSSVRTIKGQKRPIIREGDRAAVLAALACVDYIVIFDEPTPLSLIKEIQPDILVKGADWKDKDVIGSDVVRGRGGKIELVSYLKGYSTTKIIQSAIKSVRHAR